MGGVAVQLGVPHVDRRLEAVLRTTWAILSALGRWVAPGAEVGKEVFFRGVVKRVEIPIAAVAHQKEPGIRERAARVSLHLRVENAAARRQGPA